MILNTPPAKTPIVASVGFESFLRNAASICVNKKHGNTNLIGIM